MLPRVRQWRKVTSLYPWDDLYEPPARPYPPAPHNLGMATDTHLLAPLGALCAALAACGADPGANHPGPANGPQTGAQAPLDAGGSTPPDATPGDKPTTGQDAPTPGDDTTPRTPPHDAGDTPDIDGPAPDAATDQDQPSQDAATEQDEPSQCIDFLEACDGRECGEVSNGCGGVYRCGTCTGAVTSCNADGQCACDPAKVCTQNQLECGTHASTVSGCEPEIDCGTCADPTPDCGVLAQGRCSACMQRQSNVCAAVYNDTALRTYSYCTEAPEPDCSKLPAHLDDTNTGAVWCCD